VITRNDVHNEMRKLLLMFVIYFRNCCHSSQNMSLMRHRLIIMPFVCTCVKCDLLISLKKATVFESKMLIGNIYG
jgi:hypothetical protein